MASCPHCQQTLTPAQVKSLWGSYTASLRKTTSKIGRPRKADRCPCGEMTKKRAAARCHRCYKNNVDLRSQQ